MVDGVDAVNRLLIPLACLALTACAHAPEPRIVYREIKVPVPVPCKVSIPPRSRFADQEVDLQAGILGLVKSILAGNSERDERLAQTEAALEACGR